MGAEIVGVWKSKSYVEDFIRFCDNRIFWQKFSEGGTSLPSWKIPSKFQVKEFGVFSTTTTL